MFKETKTIQTPKGEKIIDDLANSSIEIISEALTNKDKTIGELKAKIKDLEAKESESKIKWTKGTVRVLDETKIQETNNFLTKVQGILTSNLRTRRSSVIPYGELYYMAFFRSKYNCASQKHSWEECQKTECQECEIPVIFRIRSSKSSQWLKPNLKKGDKVILEGTWANSDHSSRPSFTVYSYQILSKERIERTTNSSDQLVKDHE